MLNDRLASGDREGNVVVWDVLQVGVVCKLGNPKGDGEGCLGVMSLAWILKDPCLLAVVLGPATLVVWDIQGTMNEPSHRKPKLTRIQAMQTQLHNPKISMQIFQN